MELYELIIALTLGILTLLAALWLFGAKRRFVIGMTVNSALSVLTLYLCAEVFGTVLKLNAFTLYLSALFGFAGVGACFAVLA